MKIKLERLVLIFSFILFFCGIGFAGVRTSDYLCELGRLYYSRGQEDEALHEFHKALLANPDNLEAKENVAKITKRHKPVWDEALNKLEVQQKQVEVKEQPAPTVEEKYPAEQTLDKPPHKLDKKKIEAKGREAKAVIFSGEQRLSLGVTSKDVIWKDANADKIGVPREKNWRYLWGDQRHNTYDPGIYDRLKLDMQTQFNNPLNAFMEITIDPWTFIGKNHLTVTSTAGGDIVDMDLKYWSADSRTINEVYRSKKGNIINLKQIKIDDGKTTVSRPTGLTDWGTTYNSIQAMDIDRDYRPVRKLWFDYKQDDYILKVFPLSDQYEALTTDDPLRLSNNHVYWEESPWLDEYEPSMAFTPDSGLNPLKKGRWIRRLSFFTKDSSDDYPQRLTFLRGASFKSRQGISSFEAAVATPMSLWDEYERSNSLAGALRLKVPFEDLKLGFTSTSKLGFNGGSNEALNQAGAVDFNYRLADFSTLYGEISGSHTDIQEVKGFDTKYDGIAGKLGLSYDDRGTRTGFSKGEIYLAHMDSKFYPGLSNYRYTRRDEPTFSRHIYFAEIKEDDKSLIWGDGIDRGRNVAGFKLKTKSFENRLDTDIKYRNVHKDSGKYVESVLRTESTYQVNPRLTSKLLTYYQHLQKTHAKYDPIIYAKTMYSLTDYFSEEDLHPENSAVIDDKDPSVGAFGLGGKYGFTEKLSLEGIYERTNDPLDFPRGLLNDTYVTSETRDGIVYDKVVPFLYDQKFFDLPPYRYYNIAKTKLIYTPQEAWEFILSYTFNENKYASGIDDNINHVGLETKYLPSNKLTFWLKYIYSRLIDVYKQNKYQHSDFYEGHHNVFFGSEYKFDPESSFTFLYGEFVGYDDPYQQALWSLSALDTQHIYRLFYRRKF
ncbi:MAG: hypothetical protein A3J51_02680 [Omnitrophica WOR_2 bacterium RIFCSPHIGHO2_02_FULL_45_21]|nr:MAG: hypothetical protein A3J51_02680 [Omnitrophica WOR_2 bacterium RIFCSPHIGHO2_02_FULL_45_21]